MLLAQKRTKQTARECKCKNRFQWNTSAILLCHFLFLNFSLTVRASLGMSLKMPLRATNKLAIPDIEYVQITSEGE